MAVFQLDSTIRDYDWGTESAISELLGRTPNGRPEAELWMGAHPGAPSRLKQTDGPNDLLQLLTDGPALLGSAHSRLPYLFKVLAAASPLSLQVHPSMDQARSGFEREEKEGIPLSAAHRCYKDPSHKPELLMALSPFSALCGFVDSELMNARLQQYGLADADSPLAQDVAALARDFSEGSLSRLFSRLFELSSEELGCLLATVRKQTELDASSELDSPELATRSAQLKLSPQKLKRFSHQLLKIQDKYPGDPGVLGALMLHWVELEPGQALYLPAGILHSYLEGTGLEIMASSDNVLRGGMTSKHVSVSELKRTMRFEAQEPNPLTPSPLQADGGATVARYETPSPEFQLSLITLESDKSFAATGPDILLVLEGELEARSAGQATRIRRGDQIFCSGDESYSLHGEALVARASPNEALHITSG